MKKRIPAKKLLWFSGIAAVLLLVSFVMYSLRSTSEKAGYTSYSTGHSGVKALYLLTGEMGFETGRFEKSARFIPQHSTLVAVYPDKEAINDKLELKYLQEWVKAGNTLIIASDRDSFINYEIASEAEHGSFNGYTSDSLVAGRLGEGWVLLYDSGEELVNSHLDEVHAAVGFLELLTRAGFKKVYFNEYYHGLTDNGPLLLDIIGPAGRLILLQLAIALAAYLIVLGIRFGKPVEVFEIIKRRENENLIAISNLYMKSRSENIVVETYVKSFRAQLLRYLGLEKDADDFQLSAAAASDRLLKHRDVGRLLRECGQFAAQGNHAGKRGSRVSYMLHLIGSIEEIGREIR